MKHIYMRTLENSYLSTLGDSKMDLRDYLAYIKYVFIITNFTPIISLHINYCEYSLYTFVSFIDVCIYIILLLSF
ncbi:MAG: hypothetical protein EXX96DRAFT_320882 [Benjaminiella poitrasii]|nr:MAG: hypothetical protein EXX96DRAFT_320882 [Benjaminiella poitrasii]